MTPPPLLQRTPIKGFDPLNLYEREAAAAAPDLSQLQSAAVVGLAALAAAQPDAAMAKGGEYGVFEGRIISLAHPTIMATVYAATAYSAFSGWQWRQLRLIGGDITEAKNELKAVQASVAAAEAEEKVPDAAHLAQVAELQTRVDALTATRKDLAGADWRAKHYQIGSVVLGLGTSFAIEGPINTFIRAQKLFPGPHLYAGAGIVVCWAMAASLVPLMAKGKDAARIGHMAFNALAIGLFTWQIPTGWEITQKVIKFTKFP